MRPHVNTTGDNNTATGCLCAHIATPPAAYNTANGVYALYSNTTGLNNTANGVSALYSNTTGYNNTANGVYAISNNTTGFNNTANGYSSLYFNTTGNNNTANGVFALYRNTTGSNNLANGYQSLVSNTTGDNNMANGALALFYNTTGFYNMANGSNAMVHNTTGSYNVAEGLNALRLNTTGSNNTAVGLSALLNNTTGGVNIAVGVSAGSALTTGSNNIEIGNVGVAAESGKIRLGTKGKQTSTYIAGISGVAVAGGVGVIVDSNGHLGTVVSSGRFKDAIQPMDKTSEAIFSLQPVTFRYKQELDPEGIPQFGLVAEQVEKVNPDLVARDEQGKPYTVRYEAVNTMLLNEFLKAHRKMEELEATVGQLKSAAAQQKELAATVAKLQSAMEQQAVQLQKVYDQLTVQRPAPRLVSNGDWDGPSLASRLVSGEAEW